MEEDETRERKRKEKREIVEENDKRMRQRDDRRGVAWNEGRGIIRKEIKNKYKESYSNIKKNSDNIDEIGNGAMESKEIKIKNEGNGECG